MSDIFLSYSRKDSHEAAILATLLQENGLTVWWDRKLVAGDPFHRVIDDQIIKAKAVVVLWSPNSVDSEWVLGEAQAARDLNKLVPIKIADCRLPLPYRALHVPEVFKGKSELDDFVALLTEKCATRDSVVAATIPAQRIQISSDSAEAYMAYKSGLACRDKNDFEGAARHFHVSANLGFSWAKLGLGYLYLEGWGVERNYAQAAHYFELAAGQGIPDAAYVLGEMYLQNRNDRETALKWFRRAANGDQEDAIRRIRELAAGG